MHDVCDPRRVVCVCVRCRVRLAARPSVRCWCRHLVVALPSAREPDRTRARWSLCQPACSSARSAKGAVELVELVELVLRLADLDPLLTQPLDLLVCELAHVEPKKLFTYLANKEIGQVAFMHLSRHYREKLDELKNQANSILGDLPHTFLDDGDLIEV